LGRITDAPAVDLLATGPPPGPGAEPQLEPVLRQRPVSVERVSLPQAFWQPAFLRLAAYRA